MNDVTKRINIELYNPTSYTIIKAQQYDDARAIEFTLYNQGEPYTIPDDVAVTFEGVLPDGTEFARDCSVLNNVVTVVLDRDILYEKGVIEANVVLCDVADKTLLSRKSDNTPVLSSISCRIYVHKRIFDKYKYEIKQKSLAEWLVINHEKLRNFIENHVKDFNNPHRVTKDQVGLGNVDNTSAMDMPVSNAQQKALDEHNTSGSAHQDIRNLIKENTTSINNLDNNKVNMSDLINLVYPIGSIYMSVKDVSPATFLGGTWERWGQGRMPIGVNTSDTDFNAAEKSGGTKTVTLTTAQLPSHSHNIDGNTGDGGSHSHTASSADGGSHSHSASSADAGSHHHQVYQRENYKVDSDGVYALCSNVTDQLRDTTDAGSHNHTITVADAGSHNHTITVDNGGSHSHTLPANTGASGSGNAHNNMPPYITCYMWKRVEDEEHDYIINPEY